MSHYWAKFAGTHDRMFRFDTRVYLRKVERPRHDDPVLGAIVAKNPGSAQPSCLDQRGMQAIRLDGDNLLPTVRSILCQAFDQARREIPQRSYVQVFNLFYLCDENLRIARRAIANGKVRYCPAERCHFPWLWYAWGELGLEMPSHAGRFNELAIDRRFYFDKNLGRMRSGHPGRKAFPKHTQGLPHKSIVRYIARLLRSD